MKRTNSNSRPGDAERQATSFGGLSRSELMSRVRSRGNATTELRMVAVLRSNGLSGWRRHARLLGSPDFTWRKERVALFIDGCFWHGHDCGRNLTPRTNASFWQEKIRGNAARDRAVSRELRRQGWSVIRVWECQLKKAPERTVHRLRRALQSRN